MNRPLRFHILTAAWFSIVGPAFILPVPFLNGFAYLVGFVPALITGILYGRKYRTKQVPIKWFKRATIGAGLGSIVTTAYAGVFVLAIFLFEGSDRFPVALIDRVWGVTGWLVVFGVSGALGGAFASALLPVSIREQSDA